MSRSDRDLTTPIRQVFGDPGKGTICRVCGREVDDGRSKHCSKYCKNLSLAVMSMLNWSGVRRRVLDRDEYTCQSCGFDHRWITKGREHIRSIIFDEHLPERPRGPSVLRIGDGEVTDEEWEEYRKRNAEWCEQRDELKDRYGDPSRIGGKGLEVDHITPISEGGHPFDPANLQTLCEDCHQEKTAREAGERAEQRATSRPELESKLFEYVDDGSGGASL